MREVHYEFTGRVCSDDFLAANAFREVLEELDWNGGEYDARYVAKLAAESLGGDWDEWGVLSHVENCQFF